MKNRLTAICLVLALAPASGMSHAAGCSALLQTMAQQHANDMARRNSLDHNGFMRERGPRGAMAENVAVGCATEACAREVWMKSAPHRANMMLGGCQAVASAVARSGRRYWAMEIGGAGNFARQTLPRHSGAHRRITIGGEAEFDDHGRGAELH